jgi:hypothetical protein
VAAETTPRSIGRRPSASPGEAMTVPDFMASFIISTLQKPRENRE